ncbi:MAG TPA: S8 family serine peptidase [Anaerolineales bacterium]
MNHFMVLTFRMVSSLIMIVTLFQIAMPATPVRAQGSDGFLPNEVVMKLSRISDLSQVASSYALHPTPLAQFGTRAIFRMRILDGTSPQDKAADLAADSRVIYAEPNFIGQAPEARQRVTWAKGDESQGFEDQWAAIMIRLPEAHMVTRGAGITVAVLDTGVDASHPALAGRLVNGYDFVDLDSVPNEEGNHEQNVTYGHGTHVAGLVALVAPQAKIMPLRVLDEEGNSNIWVLAEAMAYAVNPDGNLKTDDGAHVINLSLSTERPTHLLADIGQEITCIKQKDDDDDDDDEKKECLTQNSQKGVVIVASAGNSGSTAPEYPAAEGVSGSLSVGASTPIDSLASFSNYGAWVHIAAPGQDILSSVPGGEYAFWSGTSMAAPLVAGEAALVRAVNPRLDAAAIVQRIVNTSFAISGPVPRRLDAAAALGIPLLPLKGEHRCDGALGPVTVDNILVTSDQTCVLVGTRVTGNIKVEARATLRAIGIQVKGNIQAKGAMAVRISESLILGSVQFEEGESAYLQFTSMSGGAQFFKNTGSLTIVDNTIGGNLQCKENRLPPTGGRNLVQGNKEGQCSNL